jgi:hypothetical protein
MLGQQLLGSYLQKHAEQIDLACRYESERRLLRSRARWSFSPVEAWKI